jgi:hypothetical protein
MTVNFTVERSQEWKECPNPSYTPNTFAAITLRQASQTMLLGLILFGLVIATVVRLLPPELTASLTTPQMVLIILLVMVVLDAILLVASLFSFQRSRLLLR